MGIAALGAKGVSELIAILGLGLGAAAAVSTLPTHEVAIGAITLTLAGGDNLYAGDRFVLTADIDVSFGDVFDGGGSITVEFIEEGTGVLESHTRTNTGQTESLSLRLEARAIGHGDKFYYVKVTVTGDDDIAWWPIDETVTRTRESNTVHVEVKKPIEVTTTLLTPTVPHGGHARALLKVSNHSETPAFIVACRMGDSIPKSISLAAGTTDHRYIDHRERHWPPRHNEDQTWFIEPIEFYYHAHFIETLRGTVVYDQLAPARKQVFDPLPVGCPGTAEDRRVGYLDREDSFRDEASEQRYMCMVRDASGEAIACAATLRDDYGNVLSATADDGKLTLAGTLVGRVGTLTLEPESRIFAPYTSRVWLSAEALAALPDTFEFHPRRLPPIRGRVTVANEHLQVAGARVSLVTATGKVVSEAVTTKSGEFALDAWADSFEGGTALVRARLPWWLSRSWMDRSPAVKIRLADVERSDAFVSIRATPRLPGERIKLAGRALLRTSPESEPAPVAGLEIVIRDEFEEILGEAVSDDFGRYAIALEPGRRLLEVVNAEALGFQAVPPQLCELQASHANADIVLRLPEIAIERRSPAVVKLIVPHARSGDKVVVLRNREVLLELEATAGAKFVALTELAGSATSVALRRAGSTGPRTSIADKV